MKNLKIDEDYYLVNKQVNVNDVVEIDKPISHIFVIDCSGSMSSDLPKIRQQLKNRLPNMRIGDDVSIIWFSGRNDAGILKEEVEVKSLKTLTDLNNAIDRWLVPDCLTAFLKPLQLTKELIGRIKTNRPENLFSLVMLTDGYNNDSDFKEVLKTLDHLKNDVSAACFIEYGFYADSQALTKMATSIGGSKIECSDFDEWQPVFDSRISSSITSGKKISVDVPSSLYDFAFSCDNGQILLYNIQDGKVLVNENLTNIYFFNSAAAGTELVIDENVTTALYAAINCLSDRFLNEHCEKLFYLLGDNYYYRMLLNAYGKQKLNAFKSEIKECVSDVTKRFPEGKSEIKPVPDNAFCLMNLIDELSKMDNCLLFTNHKDFNYNRIGAKRVAIGSKLTEKEKTKLTEAKNVAELMEVSKELEHNKLDLKFITTNPDAGSPIKNLVWNSERANLSILVKYNGDVVLPKNNFNVDSVASFKYNTYTIIKDGIINIKYLPVSYSDELRDLLKTNNVLFDVDYNEDTFAPEFIVIDLTSIPIINRSMVSSISSLTLAELEWNLVKIQGSKKVVDHYKKLLYPKTSEGFVELVGFECSEWLKGLGITDFNGFAPKTSAELSGDVYNSVNLITKIKALSSLPKVEDVLKKIENNLPLKLNEHVMSDEINAYNIYLKSIIDNEYLLKKYLTDRSSELDKIRRNLLQKKAEIVFSIILSKGWFKEFKSFDENTLNIILDGQSLDITFLLEEKEVKL